MPRYLVAQHTTLEIDIHLQISRARKRKVQGGILASLARYKQ